MQRDTSRQHDIVCPSGEINLRNHSGGTVTGGTASGTASVEQRVAGNWVPLTAGGVQVTIDVVAGQAEILPDPLFHATVIRLTGISGTVHVELKS